MNEAAWSLVEREPPPELPQWIVRLAETAKFEPRERRAFVWAMYLLSRLTGQAISTAIFGFRSLSGAAAYEITDITAGFIPFSETAVHKDPYRLATIENRFPSVDTYEGRYSFGVVIGVATEALFEDVSIADDGPSQIVGIEGFPVVAELRSVNYSSPPSPSGASAACFAKPRASKRFFGPTWTDGLIIARHSLSSIGFSTGLMVPMSNGALYGVVDIDDSTTIDAAVLSCGQVPPTAVPLALAPAIAPGGNCDIRGASGTFAAQVLRINDHPELFRKSSGSPRFY